MSNHDGFSGGQPPYPMHPGAQTPGAWHQGPATSHAQQGTPQGQQGYPQGQQGYPQQAQQGYPQQAQQGTPQQAQQGTPQQAQQGYPGGHPGGQAPMVARVPGCPHAYPLVEREASFSSAFKIAWKTKGYALFRYLHLCLFAFITAIMGGALFGIGTVLALYVHNYAGAAVFLGGIAAMAFFWVPVLRRKLLGTLCGHVAVLTELVTKGQIGNGEESQFDFAKQLVTTKLGELETLWEVHLQVLSTLNQFYRVLDRAEDWLPIDLSFIEGLTRRFVAWATPYVEAVIISYGLARGDSDFASAAIDGLCYSAQNGKDVFKTAIRVAIWDKLMMLPVWLISLATFLSSTFYVAYEAMGGDFAALIARPGKESVDEGLAFVVAFFIALFVGGGLSLFSVTTVRESMVKPTLMTMVMIRFHAMIENQPLDPAFKERIASAGGSLDELDKLSFRMRGYAPDP